MPSVSLWTNYGSAWLDLSITETTDSTNNTSSVRAVLTLNVSGNGLTTNNSATSYWSMNIAGNPYSGSGGYAFNTNAGVTQKVLLDQTVSGISHNSDGTKSITVSASFDGAGNFPIGDGSIGDTAIGLTDFNRKPTATAAPTVTTRVSGSTSIVMSSSGTSAAGSPAPPAITEFVWTRYTASSGGTGTVIGTFASPYTWTGAGIDTDYWLTAAAVNSEGFGPESTGSWAYAAPRITGITLPSQGTVGKPYLGTVSGNNVDSYSAVSGSLPPGLSFSGGNLSGTPLTPGTYTFKVRATRNGVSYVDSATQTIQILAGGPWVKSPNGTAVFSGNITGVLGVGGTTYVYTPAPHGISEINQPITLSGFSGGLSWLNNAWLVKSWTDSTLELNAPSNQPLISASGSYESQWKRSSIKVYVNGQWVQAWMRYWDAASQTWKNTA